MKKVLFLAGLVCATSIFAADGETLFKTCATCHGAKAEKSALNKSQIIAGWDAAKIVASVNGYKDGSYGGAMKGVMKPIASGLSDEDLKAVAATIASYK